MAKNFNLRRQLYDCSTKIKESVEQIGICLDNNTFINHVSMNDLKTKICEVNISDEIRKAKIAIDAMNATINLLKNEEKRRRIKTEV